MVRGRETRKFQTVNVVDCEGERKRPQDDQSRKRVRSPPSSHPAILSCFSSRPFVSRVLRSPIHAPLCHSTCNQDVFQTPLNAVWVIPMTVLSIFRPRSHRRRPFIAVAGYAPSFTHLYLLQSPYYRGVQSASCCALSEMLCCWRWIAATMRSHLDRVLDVRLRHPPLL